MRISRYTKLKKRWPQSVAVNELISTEADASQGQRICATLMQMLMVGLIEVDAHLPACTKTVTGRALASAHARMQATRQAAVTHLRHESGHASPRCIGSCFNISPASTPRRSWPRAFPSTSPPGKTRGQAIETALSELANNALLMS
jgi:hypothetical protein